LESSRSLIVVITEFAKAFNTILIDPHRPLIRAR
jgi:hypothetical protein